MKIHPLAIVDPGAELASDVEVGPYAIVEKNVYIGEGTKIGSHAIIGSYTTIGNNCQIAPHAVAGMPPQDLKYKGEPTTLTIGDGTIVREFASLHRGTVNGGGKTEVGSNCFLMAYVHLAHDCHIGNNVIIANSTGLAGHVTIEDNAIIGGLTAIHQFVRIGAYSIVGGASGVPKDIVPYSMSSGNRVEIQGLNLIGLKRNNFSQEDITKLKLAFKLIFNSDLNTTQALEAIEKEIEGSPVVDRLVTFIKNSERGICK